jgi:hypothetical protein
MIRRYNLSHPVGQPMPEDWIHLPDSVVAATDYDALAQLVCDLWHSSAAAHIPPGLQKRVRDAAYAQSVEEQRFPHSAETESISSAMCREDLPFLAATAQPVLHGAVKFYWIQGPLTNYGTTEKGFNGEVRALLVTRAENAEAALVEAEQEYQDARIVRKQLEARLADTEQQRDDALALLTKISLRKSCEGTQPYICHGLATARSWLAAADALLKEARDEINHLSGYAEDETDGKSGLTTWPLLDRIDAHLARNSHHE